jgi:hypothetical protein
MPRGGTAPWAWSVGTLGARPLQGTRLRVRGYGETLCAKATRFPEARGTPGRETERSPEHVGVITEDGRARLARSHWQPRQPAAAPSYRARRIAASSLSRTTGGFELYAGGMGSGARGKLTIARVPRTVPGRIWHVPPKARTVRPMIESPKPNPEPEYLLPRRGG